MKRTLAALAVAFACSVATSPTMAQDAAAAQTQPAPATAQPAPATTPTTTSAATPAPAATGTAPEGLVGPAPADKAQVVFFRPSKFAGGAIGFKVREGEQELGKLRSGNYFIAQVTPGKHTYTVHSEAKDDLNMEVDAGETYYVQGTISMGFMVGHPHLAPSDKATFDGMSSKLDKSN
ncbi:MAG: DUF2846 domain-containing protein [Xanthomonadales bacterium]|nr:DUF2846 domain-containing protein [Xanthomonadales bacterium]